MSDVVRDMRMAARRLRQAPGFASVAVLTLALGIAATSAIFSVVDAVVLRPLPYDHADRLVRITADLQRLGVSDIGLSASELFDYRDRTDLFDDITGIWPITANLTGSSRPERVETVLAGPTYFQMLGTRPQLGRLFGPQDYHTGIATVVVISDGLWRRGFGADPRVIGRKLRIDNDAYEIVGVTPPSFRHPSVTLETDVEVWAPAGWITAPFPEPAHGRRFLPAAIARLKPGVTVAAAEARLEALGVELRRSHPSDYPERTGWTPRVLPLKQDLIASARQSLLIVMAAVVLVLLIGCVNIANLQLARAAGRERDVAVRRALGASPARIVREHLIESLVIAALGGGVGLVLTLWTLDLVLQLAPNTLAAPIRGRSELDHRGVQRRRVAADRRAVWIGAGAAVRPHENPRCAQGRARRRQPRAQPGAPRADRRRVRDCRGVAGGRRAARAQFLEPAERAVRIRSRAA